MMKIGGLNKGASIPSYALVLFLFLFSSYQLAQAQNKKARSISSSQKKMTTKNVGTKKILIQRCAAETEGIQTDMAGDYPGNSEFPQGRLSGEATLAVGPQEDVEGVKFNPFSLTSTANPSLKITGRLIPITTCGYTTVTMMIDNLRENINATGQPIIISLRACKTQTVLKLFNATTSTTRPSFSFSSILGAIKDKGKWGRCGTVNL